jgi:hypothetical protein
VTLVGVLEHNARDSSRDLAPDPLKKRWVWPPRREPQQARPSEREGKVITPPLSPDPSPREGIFFSHFFPSSAPILLEPPTRVLFCLICCIDWHLLIPTDEETRTFNTLYLRSGHSILRLLFSILDSGNALPYNDADSRPEQDKQ